MKVGSVPEEQPSRPPLFDMKSASSRGDRGARCLRRWSELRLCGADFHPRLDLDALNLPEIGTVSRSSFRLSICEWVCASTCVTLLGIEPRHDVIVAL